MSKQFFSIVVMCMGLAACGGGKDQPVQNTYGYNVQQGGICPSSVAVQWNNLIASRCNPVQGQQLNQQQAQACVWGAKEFQDNNPGINCDIAVGDTQWCPTNNWQSQQFFTINDPIIQSIYDKYGWAAGPNWRIDHRGHGQGRGPRRGGPGGF